MSADTVLLFVPAERDGTGGKANFSSCWTGNFPWPDVHEVVNEASERVSNLE